MAKFRGIENLLGINKLPKNYHIDLNERIGKYMWYYKGKKEYSSKKYFQKYNDAVEDAIKHSKKSSANRK